MTVYLILKKIQVVVKPAFIYTHIHIKRFYALVVFVASFEYVRGFILVYLWVYLNNYSLNKFVGIYVNIVLSLIECVSQSFGKVSGR